LGLGINAGHDLSLDNIQFFKQNIPGLLEVSIGHAHYRVFVFRFGKRSQYVFAKIKIK
jgi:pyridoxine 5'-phosphate synthase PdxJ